MISHPPSQDTPPRNADVGRPRAVPSRPPRIEHDARDERERLLDEALDETFPASDPPPWTMGGSHVSTLRH
jgi:hypothetical protein